VVSRDWTIEPVGRRFPRYRPRITLGPKGGLPVRVSARQRDSAGT
jgi:hypothetical protein